MAKKHKDVNQLAKNIVDIEIGEEPIKADDGKNAAAVALGHSGGLKASNARANVQGFYMWTSPVT